MWAKWLQVIAEVLIGYSLFVIGQYFYSYKKADQDTEQIIEQRELQSLAQLSKQYTEMVGWIKIDGTRLNQPIMQSKNNDFYLTHNYKGEEARTGAIFMDYRNDAALLGRNTILYGHVLRTGSMFGDLPKYENEQYAKQHEIIQLELLNETVTLQVFAAYKTTTEDPYLMTEFTDASFVQYIQSAKDKSAWLNEMTFTPADQLITLSTCTTSLNDEERFVVHAKVVERIEKK